MTPGPAVWVSARWRPVKHGPGSAVLPRRSELSRRGGVAQAAIDLSHQIGRGQGHAVVHELDRRGDHLGVAQDTAVAELLGGAELGAGPGRGEAIAVHERHLAVAAVVEDEQAGVAVADQAVEAERGEAEAA